MLLLFKIWTWVNNLYLQPTAKMKLALDNYSQPINIQLIQLIKHIKQMNGTIQCFNTNMNSK